MLSTSEFKSGKKIEIDGKPFEIIKSEHYKPGKGGAMVRTKLRQMITGQVLDKTFRSGEKVAKADVLHQEMQFLYKEATDFVFMNMETYDQMNVAGESVGEKGGYIKEGDTVKVLLYKGELIGVDLPASVVLEVAETEPGIQGDRVSGATKPATMETGLNVNVPLFINIGDKIKIDTRSGEYLGRE
ncbi:elongation factor P [Salidesulfovibrio onnuriiensis]|uniref:elongation factor P n=1 Tax=Salidesulfovibrio onnuriiensis TaxID=2583823 RepID=UPI0011CA6DD9|nr:elongation factor P [Salidesulfovibrio onnuriiensis]